MSNKFKRSAVAGVIAQVIYILISLLTGGTVMGAMGLASLLGLIVAIVTYVISTMRGHD